MQQTDILIGHATARNLNARRSTVSVSTREFHAQSNAIVLSVATNSMMMFVTNFTVHRIP